MHEHENSFFFLICFINFHLYSEKYISFVVCSEPIYDTITCCVHINGFGHPYPMILHCTMLLKCCSCSQAAQLQERMLTYNTNIHLQILESYKMCIIAAPQFSSIFNTILFRKTIRRHKFLMEWFTCIYIQLVLPKHIGIQVKLMKIGKAHARD